MNAPLIVWAVEQHENYVGVFVDSLWISKELAEQEVERLKNKYKRDDWTVEEWAINEVPNEVE